MKISTFKKNPWAQKTRELLDLKYLKLFAWISLILSVGKLIDFHIVLSKELDHRFFILLIYYILVYASSFLGFFLSGVIFRITTGMLFDISQRHLQRAISFFLSIFYIIFLTFFYYRFPKNLYFSFDQTFFLYFIYFYLISSICAFFIKSSLFNFDKKNKYFFILFAFAIFIFFDFKYKNLERKFVTSINYDTNILYFNKENSLKEEKINFDLSKTFFIKIGTYDPTPYDDKGLGFICQKKETMVFKTYLYQSLLPIFIFFPNFFLIQYTPELFCAHLGKDFDPVQKAFRYHILKQYGEKVQSLILIQTQIP